MRYSPNHSDPRMRALYASLVVCAFVMLSVGTGAVRAILVSLALVCLGVGLYLFIKCDMTTYTYIVMENEGRQDFYIDKAVGKRGAYVCYYPLSDVAYFDDYIKGSKKEINEKYGKVFFYNYCHNRLNGDKQILVFENDGYYDAVIIELDKQSIEYLKKAIRVSKETEEN